MPLLGRFLYYKEGKAKIKKIVSIIKQKYPYWRNNKYYKKQNLIFKITCNIFFYNNSFLISLYKLIRKINK